METPSLNFKPLNKEFTIPKDLFKFVEDNQDEINDLTHALGEFFYERQPNPYAVLTCLTNVLGFIIEHNFIDAEDADHLRVLTDQTLEAYSNAILSAAEEIMRGRFNESLFEEGESNDFFYPRSC